MPTENRQSVVRRNGKFFHEIGVGTEVFRILVSDKVTEMSQWLEAQEFDDGNNKFRGMQEETEEVTQFLSVAAVTALVVHADLASNSI